MEKPGKMFNWVEEWNISFAGCGFRSIYYVGALSCILERAPQLVHGASKICGSSSGCLVAAALTVGIPIEQLCADILTTAKEARKHTLGVFHPTFSLLRTVRDSLLEKLPEDAHLRASGRLCVSLTRIADGKNVLVSEFASREELIQVDQIGDFTEKLLGSFRLLWSSDLTSLPLQVLMCSCFFPVYCGFIPPSYHGMRYVDGALSNMMPLSEQRNTITMAPFSGENDICPREGSYNFFEVHYGNISIQVNTGNVYRVCTSFLPPRLEKLAEICHNGYMDALCFLREKAQNIHSSAVVGAKSPCCEQTKEVGRAEERMMKCHKENHLDHRVIENLPVAIKKVLCEACRDCHDSSSWRPHYRDFLTMNLFTYLLTFLILPVELTIFFTKSMVSFSCTALCRLLLWSADFYRQKWSISNDSINSASQENNCICRSSGSDSRNQRGRDINTQTLKSKMTSNSKMNLCWDTNGNMDLIPPVSTRTASGQVMLNTPGKGRVINHKESGKKID
ncbi:patatin-like phospholipase domain-containing protein 2 isoform X2 [Neolamprologus brichardi]|uniref:patatin-like phospholipase domain-containing protein 2 isoform X2 n=1 Tax=Neolamprologus brichardi TaxID=32507 RepID=UPI001643E47D|nr:patatin-like phospholipase domain-containing protein 2 isoform X2 [Neolamprologus brichardi]